MHNTFQIGTIAVILFGIMLSRYDTSSLRKEVRQELKDVRQKLKEVRQEMGDLRKEVRQDMDGLRADVHRSTTLVTETLFQHAERITKLEK